MDDLNSQLTHYKEMFSAANTNLMANDKEVYDLDEENKNIKQEKNEMRIRLQNQIKEIEELQIMNEKNKAFIDSILGNADHVSGFDQLRTQGTNGLNSTAFPTLRNEYWKYTKVSGLLKKEFAAKKIMNPIISEETLALIGDHPRLTFVNGFLDLDLSILPTENGISVTTLAHVAEADLKKFPTQILRFYVVG